MSVHRKSKTIFLTSKRCRTVIPGHNVSSLYFWAIGTIKYKDGNDGQGQEPTETVEEDANCWVFASSGASSWLNVNRRLSLIHPDTEELSEE
jgi:hypothetical protein